MLHLNDEMGFLFGPFVLLPSRRGLFADGQNLRIGSRAMDLLTILVSRAGDIVSKEKLIAYTWPDTHVEEINLRVNLSSLRKILGEDPGGSRYIMNIPGRGYCFVSPVKLTDSVSALPGPGALPAGTAAYRAAAP